MSAVSQNPVPDPKIRDAAVQAVKDHPATTWAAPYESLADAVLDAATPLIRAAAFRDAARRMRRLEQELPTAAVRDQQGPGLLRAALVLDELAIVAEIDGAA